MFKIICELDKFDYDGRVFLKYKNCEPCEFTNFQLDGDIYSAKERYNKALNVLKVFHSSVLDIKKDEYNSLLNKLYYVQDLSKYRYIALFDESLHIENPDNIFSVPWIFSTIVRLIKDDSIDSYINHAIQGIYSYINPSAYSDKVQALHYNYEAIWEKFFVFSLDQEMEGKKLPGTLRNGNIKVHTDKQYYALDKYFLKYLFSKQDNLKCIPLHEYDQLLDTNQELNGFDTASIYQDYKNVLPKFFGLEFLDQLRQNRNCMKDNEDHDVIGFVDTSITYAIETLSKPKLFDSMELFEACSALGGVILPVSVVLKYSRGQCKKIIDEKLPDQEGIHIASNEIFTFNCYSMEESLNSIENIREVLVSLDEFQIYMDSFVEIT